MGSPQNFSSYPQNLGTFGRGDQLQGQGEGQAQTQPQFSQPGQYQGPQESFSQSQWHQTCQHCRQPLPQRQGQQLPPLAQHPHHYGHTAVHPGQLPAGQFASMPSNAPIVADHPHYLHRPAFHWPQHERLEPAFTYYNLSYQIPQSHAMGLGYPQDLQRFKQPVSEWDMATRHMQQVSGEYRGKPRRADQGREVKDDRENDRTKQGLKEEKYEEEKREPKAKLPDSRRQRVSTSSEESHSSDSSYDRHVDPRSFDTRYPASLGPFGPYHAYPAGVHLPYAARHLGGPAPLPGWYHPQPLFMAPFAPHAGLFDRGMPRRADKKRAGDDDRDRR